MQFIIHKLYNQTFKMAKIIDSEIPVELRD